MSFLNIDPFYIAITIVGVIVWFTRLEAKAVRNDKDLEKMETRVNSLEKEILEKLSALLVSVAELRGQKKHDSRE